MKRILVLPFTLFLFFQSCNRIDPDAVMTVTIFQFNYDSIELQGASVYSFANPELRIDDPLPITFSVIQPNGLREGRITLTFIPQEAILFDASLSSSGVGEISRPTFTPVEELRHSQREAAFITGFSLDPILGPYNSIDFRDFWEASKEYQIAKNAIMQDMKGALHLYKANQSDSSTWKWIVVLGS